MRVAMDVSVLSAGLRSGTAVYVYRLAEALGQLDEDLDLDLLYNGMPGPGVALARTLERPRVRVLVRTLMWRPLPAPLFWRPYPALLKEAAHRADVFHVGEFVYPDPRPGQPVVATVHDVTTKLFPHWHAWPNRLLHHKRLRWISRHATRVVIDAEATRSDTARALDWAPERLDVVPLARGTRADATAEDESMVRSRFGIGEAPYVLFVGTLEPRKNLSRLVEAFTRLPPGTTCRLVLAGGWGWRTGELRRALEGPTARERIVVTGGVDEATLAALYRGALAFAYPSLYEGFGLPVLEAMAAGAPVLTSRGGTLEEVAGGAAELVEPTDIGDIVAGLERLLRSPDVRERLRALGLARAREFSWQRTARLTMETYRRALEEAA